MQQLFQRHPLITTSYRSKFKETVAPETFQAIDEMMVLLKVGYKPIKWGYKLWCKAGISSYVNDFELVGGMGTVGIPANIQSTHTFGESENVVLQLTSELNPKKHKIFSDNCFANPEWLIQLKSMDIYMPLIHYNKIEPEVATSYWIYSA